MSRSCNRKRRAGARFALRLCASAILLVLVARARAQGVSGNPDYGQPRGQIPVRDGRPYNLLFLQFLPERPDTIPQGARRFDLQLDVFNSMLIPAAGTGAHTSIVVEDNEEQRLLATWRCGVARGEAALFVPIAYRNGGFLDPILSAWHSFWGVSSANRDDPFGRGSYPRYRSILFWQDREGTHVDAGNAFGLGDVSATYKRGLIRATPHAALSIRGGIKLPTGNPSAVLGSGGVDAGLMLDARYSLGRSVLLYAGLGQVLMGHATRVPNAEPSMVQYQLGLEWMVTKRDSLVLTSDVNGVAVRTGNQRADQSQSTFTFGYQRVMSQRVTGYFSISENGDWSKYTTTLLGNVGPDLSATVGVRVWQ